MLVGEASQYSDLQARQTSVHRCSQNYYLFMAYDLILTVHSVFKKRAISDQQRIRNHLNAKREEDLNDVSLIRSSWCLLKPDLYSYL
jgi:hypothetical protein